MPRRRGIDDSFTKRNEQEEEEGREEDGQGGGEPPRKTRRVGGGSAADSESAGAGAEEGEAGPRGADEGEAEPEDVARRYDPPQGGPLKAFQVDGPVNPARHYALESLVWWSEPQEVVSAIAAVSRMVALQAWFRLFGPRQSGKTTSLERVRNQLHASGKYVCVYWSLQRMTCPEEMPTSRAAKKVFDLDLLGLLVQAVTDTQKEGYLSADFDVRAVSRDLRANQFTAGARFKIYLERLAEFVESGPEKELVVFIDEVESIRIQNWMVHFLNILRELHNNLTIDGLFAPVSVAFCGLYDIGRAVDSRAPFNVANRVVRPEFWDEAQLRELLQQYVDDSGRTVTGRAVKEIMRQTGGHPWHCNYIMHQAAATREGNPIDVEHVGTIVESMIRQRVAGIGSLGKRIRDDQRVRAAVMQLAGGTGCDGEELEVVIELGLAREEADTTTGARRLVFANTIVREVSARVLADIGTQGPLDEFERHPRCVCTRRWG